MKVTGGGGRCGIASPGPLFGQGRGGQARMAGVDGRQGRRRRGGPGSSGVGPWEELGLSILLSTQRLFQFIIVIWLLPLLLEPNSHRACLPLGIRQVISGYMGLVLAHCM